MLSARAAATIPAQPSGSLVRFKFAVEYINGYKDMVPFNDDLYPFRCVSWLSLADNAASHEVHGHVVG
jgi:hypothetical protein